MRECNNCKYKDCWEHAEPCASCTNLMGKPTHWEPQTNYDLLISKTTEELAEYLYKHDFCKTPFSSDKQNWCDGDCGKCLAEWLKATVE